MNVFQSLDMETRFNLLFKNPEKFFRLLMERVDLRGKIRPVKLPAYKKRFSQTLADWIIYHQKEIITKQVTWMGVPLWKNVLDLQIYQEIIFELSPEVILEIGSAHGGSTLYFAHLCDILNKGTVVSIDISREDFAVTHDRIVELTGNSTDERIVRKAHEIARGKSTLIIQDGDHSKEVVFADLCNYSDLVPLNGYFIVEDTVADVFNPGNSVGRRIEGPLHAVEEFVRQNSNFIIDESRERYIITQNPRGYLKRIK